MHALFTPVGSCLITAAVALSGTQAFGDQHPLTAGTSVQNGNDGLKAFQQANADFNSLVTSETLTEPTKRAAVAQQAIPILRRMADGLNAAVNSDPENASKLSGAQRKVLALRLTFEDPTARSQVDAMTASTDRTTAARGTSAILLSHWLSAGSAPAKQATVIDAMETLARSNASDESVTALLIEASRSAASPELAQRLIKSASEGMDNATANSLKQQFAARAAHESEIQAALNQRVGQPAVIQGTTLDGKPFASGAWKGKVILVDHWATWCVPCRAEMPRLMKLYDKYHSQGFEIVGVSNDFNGDALTKFVAAEKIPWTQLFDADAAAKKERHPMTAAFGIEALPMMVVLDKHGIVRSITARDELETLIPALLTEDR